ncbi:hypothetical protein Pfo_023906 [Paulownia fortunei]|nr:hypothetical protein Pfo_023906 [Paulownia fortunei]
MDYGGACGKHLKANTGATKQKRVEFTPLISIVNSDHGSGSQPDSETNLKGIGHGSAKNSDSSDTVSSSSSNSSSDDFFQVNPQILPKFRVQNNIPKPIGGTKLFYKNDEIDVSSEALYRLEESINESLESTSQFSDVTHESLVPHMSPTLSPPIQVMERPGDFDPNRIPASIFSRSSTPTEWSVASNDSLFSIRIGNSSFSRDHASKMGVDLYKSEELPKSRELFKSGELCQSGEPFKSGELCQSGEPYKSVELSQSGELYKSVELDQSREHLKASDLKWSGELIRLRQTSPTTKGVEPNKSLHMAKTIGEDVNPEETGIVDEPINDVPKALMNIQVDTNIRESGDSSSSNQHLDKSETSIPSFALPIKKRSSCPLCHCPDCCQAFCCCKWPSCCCRWSACSCKWIRWVGCSFTWFIWPSCSRNCLSWQSCCFKWPSCQCKCPTWSSCCCKWPSCRCKCPTWSSCCCKWASCHCKCPSWSSCCCKCPSWPSCCCKCPSWPSCKCQCSNCTWACCYCWNREPKRSFCESSYILTDGGITTSKKVCPENQHTMPPSSMKASSRKRCPCFSCSSSCSCCSCCSCSCCC